MALGYAILSRRTGAAVSNPSKGGGQVDHAEFVRGYAAGTVKARVDRSAAGFLYGQPGVMPDTFRKQQALLRAFAFGGIIAGIALFFFTDWLFALAVLLFGTYMTAQVPRAAAKGVLQAALRDAQFYEMARDKGILRVEAGP